VSRLHVEKHQVSRIGWLRAAVLGANDGIVSTASLIVGVASAAAGSSEGCSGSRRRRDVDGGG
jgi:VIT1/CCC1 family predicted Fe2+/Mn2+ transporter